VIIQSRSMRPMLSLNHQKLIRFIDLALRKQRYGTLNLTVMVKGGIPAAETAQVVKQRRRKYKTSSPLDRSLDKA
jgi:hypothetical protein